jgi:hypothetical protein
MQLTIQERKLLVPALIVLAVSCAMLGAYIYFLAHAGNTFNDFFVFWSAARELQRQPLSQIYNAADFQEFMRSLALTSVPLIPHPFVYPPVAALLFFPFGLLPFYTGLLLWNGLSLTLYLIAVRYALRPRTQMALLALLAPATVVNLLFGQTGLLTSALTLFGFSLLPKQPVRGGIMLGLLVIKPQLALLPLLILLISRKRSAIIAAAATVLLLVAASLLAFGADSWQVWLDSLRHFSGGLPSSGTHLSHGATIYFGLLGIGVNAHAALALQGVASVAVLWSILRVMHRHGGATSATVMICLVGPFLASPYALIYDLPIVSAACLMLFNEGQRTSFRDGELLVITAAWCLPLLVFVASGQAGTVAPIVLCALFVLLLRRGLVSGSAPPLQPYTA